MREEFKIGSPVVCVKDPEAEKKVDDSSFLRRLRALGFRHIKDFKGSGVPYIFINLTSRVYAHGVYGVKATATIADSAPISTEDFNELVRILKIKSPKAMQKEKEEQEEEERKRLERRRQTTEEEYIKMIRDRLLGNESDEEAIASVDRYIKANHEYLKHCYQGFLEGNCRSSPNAVAWCMEMEDNSRMKG